MNHTYSGDLQKILTFFKPAFCAFPRASSFENAPLSASPKIWSCVDDVDVAIDECLFEGNTEKALEETRRANTRAVIERIAVMLMIY